MSVYSAPSLEKRLATASGLEAVWQGAAGRSDLGLDLAVWTTLAEIVATAWGGPERTSASLVYAVRRDPCRQFRSVTR